MPRFFNTTGPCNPEYHYMLPAEQRVPSLRRLIEEQAYFVVHAARQTGKTTAMRAVASRLRAEGKVALHASLEASRGVEDLEESVQGWINAITREALYTFPEADRPPPGRGGEVPTTRFGSWLAAWAAAVRPRHLVLLLDEVDCLADEPLTSLLAQLREGFPRRPEAAPASIALVGLRDLFDYLTRTKGGIPPNPGSPFNIKAKSLTLRNFTLDEIAELYAQHTAEYGQPFAPEASQRAFWWTAGQPFLVNALA